MFNAQKFRQYVKDILFPPFSERELITLAYLVVLMVSVAVISDPSAIVTAIFDLAKRLTFYGAYGLWDFITASLDLTEFVLYGLGALAVIWILYDIAIRQQKESLETKKFVAYIFYAALSLISVMVLSRSIGTYFIKSAFDFILTRTRSFDVWTLINNIVIGFLLLRSMLTALITYAYVKLNQEHLLAMRMTDEQMNRTELVMLIVAATAIFLFLVQGNDRLVAVLLSYFYVTLLLDIYRKIFPQQDPAFIKNTKKIKFK